MHSLYSLYHQSKQSHMARVARWAVLRSVTHFHCLHIYAKTEKKMKLNLSPSLIPNFVCQ